MEEKKNGKDWLANDCPLCRYRWKRKAWTCPVYWSFDQWRNVNHAVIWKEWVEEAKKLLEEIKALQK